MLRIYGRRRRQLNDNSAYKPGQRIGDGDKVHGGGGPENIGARTQVNARVPFKEGMPVWNFELEQNEYFGFAAPSTTPNMAGIPANNFRGLGDIHGGRQ
jgi:hypothetical protein